MKSAIYAGTFDPITNGHFDIIERARALFPHQQIIIAVAKNPTKRPLFSLEQRVALINACIQHLSDIQVIGFDGLLADFARKHHANMLIRGIRSSNDVEYEIQLAQLNDKLYSGLETVMLAAKAEWRYLSSTIVREVYFHHGDVSAWVPQAVLSALTQLKNNECGN